MSFTAFGVLDHRLIARQEISTYFPRRVLWKAFLCSLVAAVVLKLLNPTGTGKRM